MEGAVRSWHETSNVDAKMYFLLDKEKTDTEKYAPVVNIDKVAAAYFLLYFQYGFTYYFFSFLFHFLIYLN